MSVTVKKKTKRVPISLDNYVNHETGEFLTSEIEGASVRMTVVQEDNMVIIGSDDFIVMEAEAVVYLTTVLNQSEIGSVLKIAKDLKTPLNLVFNGPNPHSNDSLQKYLQYSSKAMFLKLIKKLMKVGVLYQIKGNIRGSVRVIYMMNPFIARKRRSIDNKLLEIFKPCSI